VNIGKGSATKDAEWIVDAAVDAARRGDVCPRASCSRG
jgi:hypothetical protein